MKAMREYVSTMHSETLLNEFTVHHGSRVLVERGEVMSGVVVFISGCGAGSWLRVERRGVINGMRLVPHSEWIKGAYGSLLAFTEQRSEEDEALTCDHCTSTTLSTCVRPLVSVCRCQWTLQTGRLRFQNRVSAQGTDRHEGPFVRAETRFLCNSRIHAPHSTSMLNEWHPSHISRSAGRAWTAVAGAYAVAMSLVPISARLSLRPRHVTGMTCPPSFPLPLILLPCLRLLTD